MKTHSSKRNHSRKSTSNSKLDSRRVRQDEWTADAAQAVSDAEPFRAKGRAREIRSMADNDWRWYAQNPQLVKDYASFPFGIRLGNLLNTGAYNMDHSAVPGCLAVYIAPTIGFANQPTSAVNIAMRNIFTYVRKMNSGATNYEAPDMMMYILATSNVLSYVEFLKRAVGMMLDYYPLNSYYPRCLIQAMGLNWDSMHRDLVTLRGYVNQLAVRANSLVIPASLSYIARQVWMYQNIWLDSNTDKAQTYFYTPHGFFVYPGDSDQPTQLNYKLFISKGAGEQGSGLTVDDLIAFGDAMINPILASQAFNVMAGDILKAYGSNVVRISGVTESYVTLPLVSPEVQSQFENITICGAPIPELYSITQDISPTGSTSGCLIHTPITEYYADMPGTMTQQQANAAFDELLSTITASKVVNFHHGNVTPEETMVATRLTNIAEIYAVSKGIPAGNTNWTAELLWPTAGSELVATVRMFAYRDDDAGSGNYQFREIGVFSSMITSQIGAQLYAGTGEYTDDQAIALANSNAGNIVGAVQAAVVQNGRRINHWTSFDWAPQIYNGYQFNLRTNIVNAGETSGDEVSSYATLVIPWCALDFDYYTTIPKESLIHLAEAALLSEFGSPL